MEKIKIQYCKDGSIFQGVLTPRTFSGKCIVVGSKFTKLGEKVFFSSPKFVETLDGSYNFVKL